VIVALDGIPRRIRYGIMCDAGWHTRAVHVALRTGAVEQALHLASDGNGAWQRPGEEIPEVQGCVDVDLEVTPATNTLPIRRLDLAEGDHASVSAAWLRFPTLTLERLDQTYTRTDERRFLYQSGPGFTARLDVDDLGLVTRYAGIWECVATHDARVQMN
jgi:hypothetical protein